MFLYFSGVLVIAIGICLDHVQKDGILLMNVLKDMIANLYLPINKWVNDGLTNRGCVRALILTSQEDELNGT